MLIYILLEEWILHKMKTNYTKYNSGYTIIETMISVGLFLIIVSMGMNSLLNSNVILNKSKDMRSIMDNLSFIMEDMARNMRTGSEFRCNVDFSQTDTMSCESGGIISFKEAINGDRWAYKIEGPPGGPFSIYKTIDALENPTVKWVKLNSDEIRISEVSGFSVLGAEPQPGNNQQPFIMVRLIGEIQYKNIITSFNLQNSVSQRTPDIN